MRWQFLFQTFTLSSNYTFNMSILQKTHATAILDNVAELLRLIMLKNKYRVPTYIVNRVYYRYIRILGYAEEHM